MTMSKPQLVTKSTIDAEHDFAILDSFSTPKTDEIGGARRRNEGHRSRKNQPRHLPSLSHQYGICNFGSSGNARFSVSRPSQQPPPTLIQETEMPLGNTTDRDHHGKGLLHGKSSVGSIGLPNVRRFCFDPCKPPPVLYPPECDTFFMIPRLPSTVGSITANDLRFPPLELPTPLLLTTDSPELGAAMERSGSAYGHGSKLLLVAAAEGTCEDGRNMEARARWTLHQFVIPFDLMGQAHSHSHSSGEPHAF